MTPNSYSKFVFGVTLLTATCCFSETPPSSPIVRSLKDAYEHARITSEKISFSEQSLREAEGLYQQALGSSFPELSFEHQTLWQDRQGLRRGNAKPESPATNGMIRLSKTNLTGYREMAAVKSGRALIHQREFEQQHIHQLLLSDVASAFFGLLQAGENVSSTKKLQALAGQRLGELKERVRVGRTRDADAIEQELQITTLESQREEANRAVEARTDLLSYLTGTSINNVEIRAEETPAASKTLESYLSRIDDRPDVQAAMQAVNVAQTELAMTRAGRMPRLGLVANYYLYRPHSKEGTDWDAGLNLGLPLVNWGAVTGAVTAAQAAVQQQEILLHSVRRVAELDIRNTFRDWASALHQLELNNKAVELARRDYELQMRDDRRSLVTSLEVLESLNRLNTADLTLATARLNARLATLNLELAAGARPEELLK